MDAWRHWRLVLAAAAAAVAACGGGGTSPPATPAPPAAQSLPASQPGDLLKYVQERLRAQQAGRASPGSPGPAIGVTAGEASAAASGSGVEHSATTVQEQGVDEDDLIKTDGAFIYTLDRFGAADPGQNPNLLRVHRRRADGGLEAVGSLRLGAVAEGPPTMRGMLLAPVAGRLAVIGELFGGALGSPCPPGMACINIGLVAPERRLRSEVLLDLVDVTDPARAALGDRIRIDGRLIGSRLIGDTLYLVTQHDPVLAVDALPAGASAAQREAAIAAMQVGELLPQVRIGVQSPQPLMSDTDCVVQPKNASLGIAITSVTAFDLKSPTLRRAARCFAGGSEGLYMAPTSVYLATTRHAYVPSGSPIRYAPQTQTDVHKFALDGLAITYRGSGVVDGHLGWDPAKKSYRMGEHDGDLRVLSFTGELGWLGAPGAGLPAGTPSPATLTILRERAGDASLQVVGRLPNPSRPQALGKPGEQIYAVRLLGPRGYVVTFRQADPLYVLDLADPADPKALGELEMPGFSDYLFPLGGDLLLGVGKDASDTGVVGGVKLALIDVANPAQPVQRATLGIGGRGSVSGLDVTPHGLSLLSRNGTARIAMPMVVVPAAGSAQQGLHRFEVDLAAKTLTARPAIAPPGPTSFDLSGDRSVQIGSWVYYLSGGQLVGADW